MDCVVTVHFKAVIWFFFRGMGLFIGVELVTDQTTKEPATEEAKRILYK